MAPAKYFQVHEDPASVDTPSAGSSALVFDVTDGKLKRKTDTGALVDVELTDLAHVTGLLPVVNGGTEATTASGARTNLDVVQKGASGRNEAQVTKLYDSSGNVVAEINASGGLEVGSPTTTPGSQDAAFGGDVTADGDMFLGGDQVGLFDRLVDQGLAVGDHFRSGSAPSGYAWASDTGIAHGGGDFNGGGAFHEWSYQGDFLRLRDNATNCQEFLFESGSSGYVYASVFPAFEDSAMGLRYDNPSGDYIEFVLKCTSPGQAVFETRSNMSGSVVTTTSDPFSLRLTVLSLYQNGNASGYGYAYYYDNTLGFTIGRLPASGYNDYSGLTRRGLVYYRYSSSTIYAEAYADFIG